VVEEEEGGEDDANPALPTKRRGRAARRLLVARAYPPYGAPNTVVGSKRNGLYSSTREGNEWSYVYRTRSELCDFDFDFEFEFEFGCSVRYSLSLSLSLNSLLSTFKLDGVTSVVIWNSTRRTAAALLILLILIVLVRYLDNYLSYIFITYGGKHYARSYLKRSHFSLHNLLYLSHFLK